MQLQSGKAFRAGIAALILLAGSAFAKSHHQLNGTWVLVPARSDFAGQTAIQSGTVTFNDRERNIYVARNFKYEGSDQAYSENFSLDGPENSAIRNGKTFKTKAKWDGEVLKIRTVNDADITEERFHLGPDGTLTLVVERSGHPTMTLHFERQ